MRRRALFAALLPLALPAAAVAQQPGYPPVDPNTVPPGQRPRRIGPADLTFDQMTPRQRQRVAMALAGPGNPPVPPDQAAAQWNSMAKPQKRQVLRAYREATRGTGAAPPPGGYAPSR